MTTSDDEDDTHFCFKCHATITGLDNYVTHRKSKCGRLQPVAPPVQESTAELKADDFFFSLHLKSSAKNVSNENTTLENKTTKFGGILTRSKTKKSEVCQRIEEESDIDESEDESSSPPVQTGGKWKPGQNPGTNRYSSSSTSAWPPPGHTGGKWKPQALQLYPGSSTPPQAADKVISAFAEVPEEVVQTNTTVEETANTSAAPPPEHTRGKWGPTERPWGQVRKNSVYWCGPCNRRLSCKLVYDRHLRSELHFKRSHSVPNSLLLRRGRLAGINALRTISRRFRERKQPSAVRPVVSKRNHSGPEICVVCGYRVWPQNMGKHLVSQYHIGRFLREEQSEISKEQILNNMASIVKLSPYQCALCKFYCNTQQSFVDHWASELHRQNDKKKEGCYWCVTCKYSTTSTVEMGWHLVGDAHVQLTSLINNSVPIVIYKRIILRCQVCLVTFRYNAQVRAHSRAWGHRQTEGTASDVHQEYVECKECSYSAHSLLSYQRHVRKKHGKVGTVNLTPEKDPLEIGDYFCRPCSMMFSTATEAKQHRQTQRHRDMLSSKTRRCTHCGQTTTNLADLKHHIVTRHPDRKHKCIRCGCEFLLRQELSSHVRNLDCRKIMHKTKTEVQKKVPIVKGRFSCEHCSYVCSTEIDLCLHKSVLHQEPDNRRFPCMYCGKYFKEASLKKHIKTHTNERPYTCALCHFSFRRRDVLRKHIKRIHESSLTGAYSSREDSNTMLECHLCNKSFLSQPALDRHLSAHKTQPQYSFDSKSNESKEKNPKKFACHEPGCIFRARFEAELKIHMKTHSDERDYHCEHCSYSAKTKGQLAKHVKGVHADCRILCCQHCEFNTKYSSHLKRHMRLHSGAKPYKCPHCPFSCNLLDNLRKHVLNSKLHKDKCLYECKEIDCKYRTNLAKEFKSHLVQIHGSSPNIAAAYVTGLYQPAADRPNIDTPKPIIRKRKRTSSSREDSESHQLPTLASVAITAQQPSKPTDSDDVIFIQVQEEYDMATPLYATETTLFADQQTPRPHTSYIIHDETFAQTVVSYDQTHEDHN